jgi:uncharacterized LabA/DUF88 family protein
LDYAYLVSEDWRTIGVSPKDIMRAVVRFVENSSYSLARERLDRHLMALILGRTYSKTEMLQALRRGGFYLKGSRLGRLAVEELSDWMAEAFFKEPDFGAQLAAHLDQVASEAKSELASANPTRFAKAIGPPEHAVFDDRLYVVIWALATDPRSQSAKALERLLNRIGRSMEKLSEALERIEEELEEAETELDELPMPSPFEQEITDAKQRAEKAERRASKQVEKIEALRDKREDQARQIASLEAERAQLRKQISGLERERQSLTRKLDKLQHAQKSLQRAEKEERDLDKRVARLEHDLDKARRSEDRWHREKAELEKSLSRASAQVQEYEEKQAIAEEERFTAKAVNTDLREEVARLRARLSKQQDRRVKEGRARSYQEQRVGIFLDVSNLYLAGLNYYRRQIDYQRLTQEALNGRILAVALAYNVDTDWGDKAAFYEMLGGLGYEIRTKDLVVRADGSKKGDWDVGIAADIVERLDKLDVVVLGSGDGDFLPIVRKAHDRGVSVEVYAFPNTAKALKEEAEYHPMDESLLLQEVSRFARSADSMSKEELIEGISYVFGERFHFLRKLSVSELELLHRSLKATSR